MTSWHLYVIASLAVALILAQIKWPTLRIDSVSLILFAIASSALVLPYALRAFPPLKILAASILLERMVSDTATAFAVPNAERRKSAIRPMQQLTKEGLIQKAEMEAFTEFYSLRNRVVHGALGDLTDDQTTRILDLAWRLVRTLA